MILDIKNVAVLGSGVMGSGIAAQVANAGIPVLLLDMPSAHENKKNSIFNIQINLRYANFLICR